MVYFNSMRPTITITDLFGSRGRIAVLRMLWGLDVPVTTAEAARRTRLTHPAAGQILSHFSDLGIVGKAPAGRGHTYWLLRDNAYVEDIVDEVFLAERDMPEVMASEIEDALSPHAVSVYLFGSYARGEQSLESDVDVIAVADDATSAEPLRAAADELSARFPRRYGVMLSAIVYPRREAGDLSCRAPSLYQSVARDGVRLSGLDLTEWANDEE